jgi:hypothetical protein
VSAGDLLTLLLGGGAVATITALFKGVDSLRSGARARERDTITELVKQRKEAWRDRDNAQDARDYWRNWAGTVEFKARAGGIDVGTRPPEPVPDESDPA